MNWEIGNKTIESRFFLGTAGYPSPEIMRQAIASAAVNVITTSLRRQTADNGNGDGNAFWQLIKETGCHVLPNTAGCRSAKEVYVTAQMARDVFETNWIKLETVGDDYNLQPDPFEMIKAAEMLIADGFEVFPYTTDDLVICQRLVELGCKIVMPWASPIGSGQGLLNPYALRTLRERLPNVRLIVDAGIGRPSDATRAMELGADGILLNSAVAHAEDLSLIHI